MLSDIYFRGVGVRRDRVRAYTWGAIAGNFSPDSEKQLSTIREQMSRAQLDDANRRIQHWLAQKHEQ